MNNEENTKTNSKITVLSSKQDINSFLDDTSTDNYVTCTLPSQGIKLNFKVADLGDISKMYKNKNTRLSVITMLWRLMTEDSKSMFKIGDAKPSISVFKNAISYYDIDMMIKDQIVSWGDTEYSGKCQSEDCNNEIDFSVPFTKLFKPSDKLKERLEVMEQDDFEPSVWEIPDVEVKINDTYTFTLGVPTIEKYLYVSSDESDTNDDLLFLNWRLLHIVSVEVTKKDGTIGVIAINKANHKVIFNSILTKINTTKLDKEIADNFSNNLAPAFNVKVQCNACGHTNQYHKYELVSELVAKALG